MTLCKSSRVRYSCSKAYFNKAVCYEFDKFTFFTFFITLEPCSRNAHLRHMGKNSSLLYKLVTLTVSGAVLVTILARDQVRVRLCRDVNFRSYHRTGSDVSCEFLIQYLATIDTIFRFFAVSAFFLSCLFNKAESVCSGERFFIVNVNVIEINLIFLIML